MPQGDNIDDTDDSIEPDDSAELVDDIERTDAGVALPPLGSADVQIDVDPDTYRRLHAEYSRVAENGYPEGFATFAYNHCSLTVSVTVDGEPVDPSAK